MSDTKTQDPIKFVASGRCISTEIEEGFAAIDLTLNVYSGSAKGVYGMSSGRLVPRVFDVIFCGGDPVHVGAWWSGDVDIVILTCLNSGRGEIKLGSRGIAKVVREDAYLGRLVCTVTGHAEIDEEGLPVAFYVPDPESDTHWCFRLRGPQPTLPSDAVAH